MHSEFLSDYKVNLSYDLRNALKTSLIHYTLISFETIETIRCYNIVFQNVTTKNAISNEGNIV